MVCSSCKKNKGMQEQRSCGYIPKEKRQRTWTIPEINDLSIFSDVCPVYTYLENVEIYKYVNQARNLPLNQQTFLGRQVIDIFNNYQAMKQIYNDKLNKGKK